jgi:hypothetical protein
VVAAVEEEAKWAAEEESMKHRAAELNAAWVHREEECRHVAEHRADRRPVLHWSALAGHH